MRLLTSWAILLIGVILLMWGKWTESDLSQPLVYASIGCGLIVIVGEVVRILRAG